MICGLGLASGPGLAQAPSPYARINAAAASGPITIHQLRGNISVLPGPDGILLVDAGIAVSREKILAALKQQEKSLEATIAAHPTDYDQKWEPA